MSAEATVIAVAAAIYLVDCVVLLERGQALWSRAGLAFGSLHYQVRGKVVALLNPLAPFMATFRTRPLFSSAGAVGPEDASRALAPLSPLGGAQLLLIFAALPYCLYQAPGGPFLFALAAAYLNAIALLGLIWWRYRGAHIATRPLVGLAFGWLVCLPLSINALRRAALAFDVSMDAREAIGLLPEPARERARGALAAQAAEALQELEEGDAQCQRLVELQAQLTAEAGHERV
jgi:hypothetical protein